MQEPAAQQRMRRIDMHIEAIAGEYAALALELGQYEREKMHNMIAEKVRISCAIIGYGVDIDEAFSGGEDEI